MSTAARTPLKALADGKENGTQSNIKTVSAASRGGSAGAVGWFGLWVEGQFRRGGCVAGHSTCCSGVPPLGRCALVLYLEHRPVRIQDVFTGYEASRSS